MPVGRPAARGGRRARALVVVGRILDRPRDPEQRLGGEQRPRARARGLIERWSASCYASSCGGSQCGKIPGPVRHVRSRRLMLDRAATAQHVSTYAHAVSASRPSCGGDRPRRAGHRRRSRRARTLSEDPGAPRRLGRIFARRVTCSESVGAASTSRRAGAAGRTGSCATGSCSASTRTASRRSPRRAGRRERAARALVRRGRRLLREPPGRAAAAGRRRRVAGRGRPLADAAARARFPHRSCATPTRPTRSPDARIRYRALPHHRPLGPERRPARRRHLLTLLDAALAHYEAGGRAIYVHCWGGRGRAGLVGACLLSLLRPELDAPAVLGACSARTRAARGRRTRCTRGARRSPQTEAQRQFVSAFVSAVRARARFENDIKMKEQRRCPRAKASTARVALPAASGAPAALVRGTDPPPRRDTRGRNASGEGSAAASAPDVLANADDAASARAPARAGHDQTASVVL